MTPSKRINFQFNICLIFWVFHVYSLYSAAIIGFVKYGKSASESNGNGVVALIVGIGSTVNFMISAVVVFLNRKRISSVIASFKENGQK